jgi:hypothetical protein
MSWAQLLKRFFGLDLEHCLRRRGLRTITAMLAPGPADGALASAVNATSRARPALM